MKKNKFLALVVAVFATASVVSAQSTSHIPAIPVGAMQATPRIVQTGTHPTLSWNVHYPKHIGDFVAIQYPGTMILKEEAFVSVRIIDTNDNLYSEARISVNGGGYQQLFYGTHENVDPSHFLYIKHLNAGSTLDFGGRFVSPDFSAWSDFYTTRSANGRVEALVSKDSYDVNQPEDFIKPYLNGNKTIKVGPTSALVLVKRDNKETLNTLLLVTFSKVHPNNGHGNNLDGIDSSNPGQGSGGPNGSVDPSGGVDDERR